VLTLLGGWLVAFGFTQAFELPVYLRASGSLRVGFFASAITHPVVWFVFPLLLAHGVGYWAMVGFAELFAVVTEALWLASNGVHRALLWSFLANATSATCGVLLRATFGVP
jgi:hypothetical protein